MFFYVNFLTL